MLYEIYKIKQILDCSGFAFGRPLDVESLGRISSYTLRYDYLEMYNMLSEIKDIIDKMVQEEDENMNIGELMADQDQEGENNEL